MPEMTQSETRNKDKPRKKNRESHNEVERHRKKKINSGINRIGDLIPCSPALKQSKNMILEQAHKYITELKRQNDELLLNGGDEEQACEIRKLRRELSDIQKENARYIELLKSNDICLYDDPTLHWKGNSKSSKSSLIAPADQKLPLCLNSNQLSSSNQGSTVPGITFNVGQNLQKQTANVVPVQRTCNLVTPITILDKNLQQNLTSTATSQHSTVCLPVATSATTTVDLATTKGTQTAHNSSTAAPLSQSSASQPFSTSSQLSQLECTNVQPVDSNAPVSTGSNLPSLPPSSVVQVDVSGAGLEKSPEPLHGSTPTTRCVETVKDLVTEIFPSVAIESNLEAAVVSREILPAVEVQIVSAGSSSLEPSWPLSNTLPDLKSISSLTRIPSDGNTQTTWTTLQLAGNTVHPLSQSSSTTIPTLLSDQAVTQSNRQMPPYSIVTSDNTALEPVIVKMPSCQPVQVQTQTPSATNILSLNQPVQVIQVAQPFSAALNPAPAPAPAQNIILLQPPAPAPPPLPKPAVGQQIVIIQTAPNQNPIPIVSTQPSPSLMMPINAANPVVCPANQVQNVVTPQSCGGKHLVHILPRPAPVQPSSTTQQVPASTASSSQQPATFSLNGQLFALQPVTPSTGSSSQAPMQIIQPTTCEDPNTNVALNTFGALANLSQSISQMAGQNCVQLTLNPSATACLTTNTMPVNCVSVPGTSVKADAPSAVPGAPALIKSSLVKPVSSVASNLKPKKLIKKPTGKKGSVLKRESRESIPAARSDSLCPESPKTQIHDDGMNHNESIPVSIIAQDKMGQTECISQETEKPQTLLAPSVEAGIPSVLDEPMGENILGESASEEQPVTSECTTSINSANNDVFINLSEQRPPPVGADCPKIEVVSSSLPVNDLPLQHVLQDGHSQGEPEVLVDKQPTAGLKDSPVHGETTNITAANLLEVHVLSDDPNLKTPEKANTSVSNCNGLLSDKAKSDEPVTTITQTDPIILTTSVVHIALNQTNFSENDAVTSSCVSSQQVDSPLSNSSASSRNFSVASMLPDTREPAPNSISLVPPFSGCGFTEQSEVLTVAAKVIFEQENLTKKTKIQTDEAGQAVSRSTVEILSGNCHLSFKSSPGKDDVARLRLLSNSLPAVGGNAHLSQDQPVDKNCPLGLSATSLRVPISTPHSQTIPSLSINNLIHQGDGHSIENCARGTHESDRLQLTTSANLSAPSSSYDRQSEQSVIMSEYHQEDMHLVKPSIMHVTQGAESLSKQNMNIRKETSKRAAHSDDLLSAKRQKPCQGSVGLERLQPTENVPGHNKILVSQMASDPSTSLAGNIQGHREGISGLFTSNNFVDSNLRPEDMRCISQPSISEQSQLGNHHLQPLQQHHQATLLHNSNSYMKQQQAGHLRDQQHLHQQQQHHHVLLTDPVRSQSHSAQQQQRMMQQDVQMQKKRASVHGTHVSRLSLQQKPLSEQNRQSNSHPHPHHQQIQQQMPPHFGTTQGEKSCESNTTSRGLHSAHQQNHANQEIHHQHQQDVNSRVQGPVVSSEHLQSHSQVQRLMTSRSLEQQMVSQPSVVSRPTNLNIATAHRQERNRVSSYSAEALIGKSTSNSEQRIGISVQAPRIPEQMEMRKYLDVSRNKVMPPHNIHNRMTIEHSVIADSQRLLDCQTFKPSGLNQQQQTTFEVQTSRNNEISTTATMRNLQPQSYRMTQNTVMERQKHLPYQSAQEVPGANTIPIRDSEGSCHQNFMQSLLVPHIGEPVGTNHRPISAPQRPPYNSANIEFGCPPPRDALHLRRDGESQNRESCELVMGQMASRNSSLNIPFSSSSSSGDIQGRNSSPHNSIPKSNSMRQVDSQGAKNQQNYQVSINMHGAVHPATPHQSVSHGNVDQRQTVRQVNVPVSQRSRHPLQDESDSKSRQSERNRPGPQRHGNMFDSALPHLPLAGTSSMILGRQQAVSEKRPGIRFMSDGPQVPSDNSVSDQHSLTQNFAFPFIPEGTMNPPINANASFIPPVTQATATRTSALIPVDPQNTLPSFYPPYSPAHPSLSNDLTLPYFSNQMFPNPSTEKTNSTGLNNRFGSILSPPRPVGFSQTTFPLLPEMPPMHMANPSHLSNFNLTSLFPEIATALPADGSAMSPLLPISHPSASDSSKQTSNRPAHNISHILGHDSSSAV